MTRVVVLGGGIAGLTAAHELVERGIEVDVYEAGPIPGGKARSMPVPGTGTGGRPDLPGEHGFRFFPGFYRHIPDTMRRIPFGQSGRSVIDNLVRTTHVQVGRTGAKNVTILAGWPDTIRDALHGFRAMAFEDWGISREELQVFLQRLSVIATSCNERRLAQWEHVPWWEFIRADEMSEAYRTLLAKGLTRSLVAVCAEQASTRTVGAIAVQMLRDMWRTDGSCDRILNGPTNEAWIDPWVSHIRSRGGRYHLEHRVVSIEVERGSVRAVEVEHAGVRRTIRGDYFICALPVERLIPLVTKAMREADPRLGELTKLKLEWMNGIQFYLRRDVPLVRGHAVYPDTPWALTAISQAQFFSRPLTDYGDGTIKGCVSVDISNWTVPGRLNGVRADALSNPEQIKNEVWDQLKRILNDGTEAVLRDEDLVTWFLDPDIQFPNPSGASNLEPLLVNTVGSLVHRPTSETGIENLMLAADYVRTHTDLACMEGANEAARTAVNVVLRKLKASKKPCRIWPLEEPVALAPFKAADVVRYRRGRAHVWD